MCSTSSLKNRTASFHMSIASESSNDRRMPLEVRLTFDKADRFTELPERGDREPEEVRLSIPRIDHVESRHLSLELLVQFPSK